MLKLSINLNKIALLRNSRGGTNPAPRFAAQLCIDSGAHGITLHWRQDNRHATQKDVIEVRALCRDRGVEFNLEGDTREELVDLALRVIPTQLTLVPVTPGEVTSDHGWNLPTDTSRLADIIRRAHDQNIRTSIFVDPDPRIIEFVPATGTKRIEIYTEPYARAYGTTTQTQALAAVKECALLARQAGISVNAGHDLDLHNLPLLAREVPEIAEVSIGHALIADAIYLGLEQTVIAYLNAARGRDVVAPETQ